MNTHVDDLVVAPRRHFDRPEEVLEHPTLKLAEKRRILESWKHDAQRLAESTAENMSGGEESDLREVSRVLLELKALESPTAIQSDDSSHLVSGMAIGALVGAGIGLVAAAATTASVALVAQSTAAGLLAGGAVSTLRKRKPSAEPATPRNVR